MWKEFAFSYKNREFRHHLGTTDYYCNYRHDAVVSSHDKGNPLQYCKIIIFIKFCSPRCDNVTM